MRSAHPEVHGDDGDATADSGVGREIAERRARSGKKGKKGQGERGEAGERHGALLIVQGPQRHGAARPVMQHGAKEPWRHSEREGEEVFAKNPLATFELITKRSKGTFRDLIGAPNHF